MLDGVVTNLRPAYEKRKSEALREFTFKMARQGLGQSSVFGRHVAQIFHDGFEEYCQQAWDEVRRVLEETQFDPYAGCEQDLIEFLKKSVGIVYEAARKEFGRKKHFVSNTAQGSFNASFEFRYKHAIEKIETEVKILCSKFRIMKANKQAPSQNNYFYLLGSSSRVNQNSTDNSVNIVCETDLFPKLRLAVRTQIANSQAKERLLALIDEGEQLPKRTDLYNNWFTKFLSLAADSIGVVQPFLPALSQLLAQVSS